MANIILINDQDQEQTLAGVSKLVTRSTDGEAVFSTGGQGGGNVDFGLTVGETYKTIYFNTVHDTAALDTALAAAAYPDTLTIEGTDYPSNTLFAFDDSTQSSSQMPRLDIVDMSSIVAGAYAIWYTWEGLARSVVYCTANVNLNANRPISKGWALKWRYINTIRYEATLSGALDSFAGIKDTFFASSPQAYGEFLAQMSVPYITIVPTGGDMKFGLNDNTKGIPGLEVGMRAFSDDQYTHEVATILGGKLKILALPDRSESGDDWSLTISSWAYTANTGLVGDAGFWLDKSSAREYDSTTSVAKLKNVSNANVKFSCVWTTRYLANYALYRPGISQIAGDVRLGDGTQGPYTLTQTLAAGESLIVAVTSGTPGNGSDPDPETVGRMTITLTDFTEIT